MAKKLTTNIHELMKRWMEWYLNMMILRSNVHLIARDLQLMKDELVQFNEYIMRFFDKMGADPELG